MKGIGALAVVLAMMVPLGCSGGSDNDSLRKGLAGLPSDTTSVVRGDSGDAAAPPPVDTTPPAPEGPAALPDTAGLPAPPADALGPPSGMPLQPPGSAPDTIPGGFQPTPRDTRPWIPEPTTLGPASWTVGPSEVRGAGSPALLTGVRAARNVGFDRVVFQFEGPQLPGYHVEYLDGPARHCGSGNKAPVGGEARLSVRISPAQAHTDDGGRATVQPFLRTDLPTLPELRLTCDFEGEVEWVLGLDAVHAYRVISLHDPARLVVDLETDR
jgi:hypothetical protein